MCQLFKIVTIEEGKLWHWCTTNRRETFVNFIQYVLDGCPDPGHFMVWDVDNDKVYRLPDVAKQLNLHKRTLAEKLK